MNKEKSKEEQILDALYKIDSAVRTLSSSIQKLTSEIRNDLHRVGKEGEENGRV